jgi:uncharacterized protein (TIGR01777 family)
MLVRMKIVIAGGSGFLGTALAREFIKQKHDVVVLTRQDAAPKRVHEVAYVRWTPNSQSGAWAAALDGAGAVVNLAGESIGGQRWSPQRKRKLRDSRLAATRSLASAINESTNPPRVFASGSAVGYYGDRGVETLTEASAPGNDFLAGVAREWEAAAREADAKTRVVIVRTGLVLDPKEGVLVKMLPPFRMFVGGPLGSGSQYMSWIHRDDWVRLVGWALEHEGARGPVNATAPNPVTNRDFSKALGRALHRPSLLPAPALALRLMLGEMADSLLLGGQRVLPARATDLGFSFRYSVIDEAFANLLA